MLADHLARNEIKLEHGGLRLFRVRHHHRLSFQLALRAGDRVAGRLHGAGHAEALRNVQHRPLAFAGLLVEARPVEMGVVGSGGQAVHLHVQNGILPCICI